MTMNAIENETISNLIGGGYKDAVRFVRSCDNPVILDMLYIKDRRVAVRQAIDLRRAELNTEPEPEPEVEVEEPEPEVVEADEEPEPEVVEADEEPEPEVEVEPEARGPEVEVERTPEQTTATAFIGALRSGDSGLVEVYLASVLQGGHKMAEALVAAYKTAPRATSATNRAARASGTEASEVSVRQDTVDKLCAAINHAIEAGRVEGGVVTMTREDADAGGLGQTWTQYSRKGFWANGYGWAEGYAFDKAAREAGYTGTCEKGGVVILTPLAE